MAAFPERGELQELAGAIGGLRQLGAAESQTGRGHTFQTSQPDFVEASLPLGQPWAIVSAEQRTAGDVVGEAGRPPCRRPFALCDMRLGAVECLDCRLDVDERVRRERELDLAPTGEQLVTDDPAQL